MCSNSITYTHSITHTAAHQWFPHTGSSINRGKLTATHGLLRHDFAESEKVATTLLGPHTKINIQYPQGTSTLNTRIDVWTGNLDPVSLIQVLALYTDSRQ